MGAGNKLETVLNLREHFWDARPSEGERSSRIRRAFFFLKKRSQSVRRREHTLLSDSIGSQMAEAAVTMPVVLLILLFGFNIATAGYAAMAARNAANYGARVGAVARSNPKAWAEDAVQASLRKSGARGEFSWDIQADPAPGGAIRVTVDWSSPTILSGLCGLFGEGCPKEFQGAAVAVWKREGW